MLFGAFPVLGRCCCAERGLCHSQPVIRAESARERTLCDSTELIKRNRLQLNTDNLLLFVVVHGVPNTGSWQLRDSQTSPRALNTRQCRAAAVQGSRNWALLGAVCFPFVFNPVSGYWPVIQLISTSAQALAPVGVWSHPCYDVSVITGFPGAEFDLVCSVTSR